MAGTRVSMNTSLGLLTLNKDPKKNSWKKIGESTKAQTGGLNIVSSLPSKPNKILISARSSSGSLDKLRPSEYFVTYYEYDIKTGRRSRITSSAGEVRGISF